jgi:hypothetical protein
MSDEKLYAEIKAAQAIAVEKLQQQWGMPADQMAKASAGIATPKQSEPNTITTSDLEAAWAPVR